MQGKKYFDVLFEHVRFFFFFTLKARRGVKTSIFVALFVFWFFGAANGFFLGDCFLLPLHGVG